MITMTNELTQTQRTLVPKHETVAPPVGAQYFVAEVDDSPFFALQWEDDSCDRRYLAAGMVYLTAEGALARAKAMVLWEVQWAILLGALAVASLLVGCGPTEAQAMRAVAASVQDAQAQASTEAQVSWIAVQLDGERPDNISRTDWAASQRAIEALHGTQQPNQIEVN